PLIANKRLVVDVGKPGFQAPPRQLLNRRAEARLIARLACLVISTRHGGRGFCHRHLRQDQRTRGEPADRCPDTPQSCVHPNARPPPRCPPASADVPTSPAGAHLTRPHKNEFCAAVTITFVHASKRQARTRQARPGLWMGCGWVVGWAVAQDRGALWGGPGSGRSLSCIGALLVQSTLMEPRRRTGEP